MAQIRSGEAPIEVGGVLLAAEGVDLQADVHTGPTARQRGAGVAGRTSPIDRVLSRAGLDDRRTLEVNVTSPPPDRRARTAAASRRAVRLDVPVEDGVGNLLLVEDDGFLRWILPTAKPTDAIARGAPATWSFEVPVDTAPVPRGLIGAIGKRIIRVLAFKLLDSALGKVTDHFVGKWEDVHHRYRLRSFTPSDYFLPGGTELDDERLTRMARTGRALLVIHGTSSLTHSGFGLMPRDEVAALHERYDGRVIAFDHPTLSQSPTENARWLARHLPKRVGFDVDILCHSRGGLVARVLAERSQDVGLDSSTLRVGSVTFVGTPNSGTALCDRNRLSELVDSFTNLFDLVPDNPVIDALDGLIEMLKQLAVGAYGGLDGVMSMDPKGDFLRELNRGPKSDARYFAVAADYEPTGIAPLSHVRNQVADRIFGVPNDLIVPTQGVWFENGSPMFPIEERLVLPGEESVDHSSYWLAAPVREAFARWLPPAVERPVTPRAIAASATRRGPLATTADAEQRHVLKVRVLHASIEAASFPVLVGHYEGAPLAGAEAFIDARLQGRLTRRQVAGLYPESIGDVLVMNGDDQVQGVVVVGLGHRGELSPSNLAKAVTKAVLTFALDVDETAPSGSRGLSAVLIGSNGADGLLIKQSVLAILEGAATALRTLAEQRPNAPLPIDQVEIVEVYARRAHRAVHAIEELERHLSPSLLDVITIDGAAHVEHGDGGRPGDLPYEYDRGSWRRVAVTSKDLDDHTVELDFTSFGVRARADRLTQVVDRVLVQRLIEDSMEAPERAQQINRALFEMLFPADLKHDLAAIDRLHLVVDERAADFPWELLADRNAPGEAEALAVRTGMLRQLQLAERRQVERGLAAELSAIVVGNPPGGESFPTLPGARAEAQRVVAAFESRSFAVSAFIWGDDDDRPPSSSALTTALLSDDFRIVHIAAHGHFEPAADGAMPRGGVVIDDGVYLTAATIGQMRRPPDVVFLNCCHLAAVGAMAGDAGARTFLGHQPNVLAASLARELMKCGVRAVIAAGWPVIDHAAAIFAGVFYDDLLDGAALGDAVSHARRDAFKTVEGGNTWAAYQCYGDPAFRLATPSRAAPVRIRPVGPDELIRIVTDLSVDAGDPGVDDDALLRQLEELEEHLTSNPSWADRGDVIEAFGRAYGELQVYDRGIAWYRRALQAERASSSLAAVEQLANLLVRSAVERCRRAPDDRAAGVDAAAEELFREAERHLLTLMALGETAERRALLGSVYKRWARVSKRRELIASAIDQYLRADLPWCRLNALQLYAVGDVELPDDVRAKLDAARSWLETFAPAPRLDFWDRVAPVDAALTTALLENKLDGNVSAIIQRYRDVFRNGRTTPRDRDATTAHLDDLAAIAAETKRAALEQMCLDLRERPATESPVRV